MYILYFKKNHVTFKLRVMSKNINFLIIFHSRKTSLDSILNFYDITALPYCCKQKHVDS